MKSPSISLLILTHNSLKNLNQYFSWVKDSPTISEIIIVDDNSTDNIAPESKTLFATKKVIFANHPLNDDFSTQRQFGISKSKNDWILWLDSDETLSKKLIGFINNFDFNQYNYSFSRIDTFLGKELHHGENNSNRFVRLFNKNYGLFQGKVHEIWKSSKPTTSTNLNIHHHPHPNLKTFYEKINYYSSIRSQELYSQGIKADMFDVVLYPKLKFIQNYFLRLGFLDGTPGIIMALGMSFHSFLVRAKLWHLSQHSSE